MYQHLDKPGTSAKQLFVDFSIAFNTIQPHLMTSMLRNMNVNPTLILWALDFLTNRSQYMKWNGASSSSRNSNRGGPQGSGISPVLYIVYTSGCRPIQQNRKDILLKYADDNCFSGFICRDDNTTYEEEVRFSKI